jgi:CubicO group peptidase (beta-lactamase class C family)
MATAACFTRCARHGLNRLLGPRIVTAVLILPIAGSLACASAPAPDATDIAARVVRIENDIIAISAAGVDSGTAQSLLSRMTALRVPGLSVAVFDSGRIVWARAYGVVDRNTDIIVDTATLFQAASISKPVTSVGMFRLVEQRHISLDTDVNTQLRSWAVPENRFTQIEKVTPRRLVTHMSGLNVHGFFGYRSNEALPTLLQILNGEPPANSPAVRVDTVPGVRETYSGGGFVVLQLLMEDVSGRSFGDLLKDLVLKPAGMVHSTFAQPLPVELAGRATTGHNDTGAVIAGRSHVHPELAAAGLWSTPSDLARFMISVGRSYRGEPGGLLEQPSARTMLTAVPRGSGQGFGLSGEGNAFRYRHSGGNAGFTCYAVAFADIGRGMVVMTNSDRGTQLIRELTRAVAREYGWPRMWVRE